MAAYVVSKASLNGYTRILAKKHPEIRVNSVCPGVVRTDMTFNIGDFSVEEGASCPVRCASVVSSLEDMIVVTFLEEKLTEMNLTVKNTIESSV